jgi:hypothetical protein
MISIPRGDFWEFGFGPTSHLNKADLFADSTNCAVLARVSLGLRHHELWNERKAPSTASKLAIRPLPCLNGLLPNKAMVVLACLSTVSFCLVMLSRPVEYEPNVLLNRCLINFEIHIRSVVASPRFRTVAYAFDSRRDYAFPASFQSLLLLYRSRNNRGRVVGRFHSYVLLSPHGVLYTHILAGMP